MKEIKDLNLKDLKKLREMSEADLRKELAESAKTEFTLKMKKELGELKQTHLIGALTKYIAQINTVATEKGFNIG